MKRMNVVSTVIFVLLLLVLNPSKVHAEIFKDRLVLNHLVYEIRNPETGPKEFRDALEKIGEYLALEVLQDLATKEVKIQTLTGETATHHLCDEKPVLVTILRGGIPLLLGMQKIFPDSEVGFLGMARNEHTLQAATSYIALPDVHDKCVIITDTMIATAGSILDAIKIIEKQGPRKIIVAGAIVAKQGIARINSYNPQIKVYAAAVDPQLNDKGYIIPGLGDAGDRAYGKKQE